MSETWKKFAEQENRKMVKQLEQRIKELEAEAKEIDLNGLKIKSGTYQANNKFCRIDDGIGELE